MSKAYKIPLTFVGVIVDFSQPICSSNHDLVQLWMPQTSDNALKKKDMKFNKRIQIKMGVVYYIKQHPDSNLKLLGYFLEVKFQSVVSYPYETMQVKKGLS